MEERIKTSYLMWVGAQHYPTIKSYVDEALDMGVSKRLPNVAVASAMMDFGTVVFIAHDEGEYHECPECLGEIECPECRKRKEQIGRLRTEQDDFVQDAGEATDEAKALDEVQLDDELEEAMKKLKTAAKRAMTKAKKRGKKIKELEDEMKDCVDCFGSGKMEGGTGGKIIFNDDDVWEYRRYNYWLHLPKKWTPEDKEGIKEEVMCECCGGTGRLPNGRVFGCFLPQAAEYILKPEDDEKVKLEVEKKGITTLESVIISSEAKRGCGKRREGGVYAVTRPCKIESPGTDTKAVVDELVAKGAIKPEEVRARGSFIEFLAPVEIDSKRFRGIKRWNLDPAAEEEAEMALDALE